MTAFTREQIEVLQAAFEHVWGRMSRVQDDLNEASTQVVGLLQMLVEHGIMSAEQLESAVDELRATAGIESGFANLARGRVTDKSITAQILSGDTEAFTRRREAEEEDE
jgi:hypothetical protein